MTKKKKPEKRETKKPTGLVLQIEQKQNIKWINYRKKSDYIPKKDQKWATKYRFFRYIFSNCLKVSKDNMALSNIIIQYVVKEKEWSNKLSLTQIQKDSISHSYQHLRLTDNTLVTICGYHRVRLVRKMLVSYNWKTCDVVTKKDPAACLNHQNHLHPPSHSVRSCKGSDGLNHRNQLRTFCSIRLGLSDPMNYELSTTSSSAIEYAS